MSNFATVNDFQSLIVTNYIARQKEIKPSSNHTLVYSAIFAVSLAGIPEKLK